MVIRHMLVIKGQLVIKDMFIMEHKLVVHIKEPKEQQLMELKFMVHK